VKVVTDKNDFWAFFRDHLDNKSQSGGDSVPPEWEFHVLKYHPDHDAMMLKIC